VSIFAPHGACFSLIVIIACSSNAIGDRDSVRGQHNLLNSFASVQMNTDPFDNRLLIHVFNNKS